ncbi:acyl-CoA dehydrogenase C-terminal domain-containing protein [Noviherbaspirillum pedocola]|uniref:Acyl-CoA dehydrogenase C-terminal domain-containing protein n=1 Tax=Noviherbaspirillum pedocola TaxID=2801341 RepID=A0A934T0F0_9BURK|nr:acyl-CoA dehydrogenase C-terminal domain-containing protein [Noviherbaspirillum pedocola]MBK4738695.1 acyl-CoA dehydrogenase C-terminal domain-containing protein [Noviherbaspirillum pedocola]
MGTNGIQALDLLHRKMCKEEGCAFQLLASAHGRHNSGHRGTTLLTAHALAVRAALDASLAATESTWTNASPTEALANATPYMQCFGHVVIA